jgi:hypothetical protein
MIDLPLPRIAEYRFRLRADDTQRGFALPPYLLCRKIVSFYLRQEPSDRAAYDCGHAIHVLAGCDGELVFNVGGIADWEHKGRAHDFVDPVREAASRLFGTPTATRYHTFNEFDRFSIATQRAELPSLIEQYVRELTAHFPVTRGSVSYLRGRR